MWPFSSDGVTFTADNIPSLHGKVFLVTGGNAGLGKQTVLDLARHDAQEIWLAARTTEKAQQAIEDIKQTVPTANIKPLVLDLASFKSISAAAATFTAAATRLDVLLLNAGVLGTPEALTEDGYELQFGTMHVGHALLTKLLTPVLDKTAAEAGSDVRVVVLSSMAVAGAPTGGIDFATLKTTQGATGPSGRYAESKLANALYARELARHRPQWTVPAIHPGTVNTNLLQHLADRYHLPNLITGLIAVLFTSVEVGAQGQLWAATAPKEGIKSGQLYYPVGSTGGYRGAYTEDDALAKKLWDWTEQELAAYTT